LSGRRRAQTAPLIASLILAASLALSGCRAGVTSPVPSSQPVLPTEAAPFWVERPYNPGIEQELRCLGAATYSQLIRYSPSGEWTIHPTIDGQGSMCLTKRGSLVHKILFTYTAAVLDLRQLGYTFVDIPKRPYTYFWAGDGSGVYLYYPEIRQFYFVTVPEGVLTRLNYPVFIPSASRWVEIFGSPAGTSDLVVLERYLGTDENAPPHCRLCIFSPQGVELKCLDQFTGRPGILEATPEAILVTVDWRCDDGSWWGVFYIQARVYRPIGKGLWAESTQFDVPDPHLRGACLTLLVLHDGKPWVKQITAAGSEQLLFPVPDVLLGVRAAGLCGWDDTGQCMFFGGASLLVRMRERPNEAR